MDQENSHGVTPFLLQDHVFTRFFEEGFSFQRRFPTNLPVGRQGRKGHKEYSLCPLCLSGIFFAFAGLTRFPDLQKTLNGLFKSSKTPQNLAFYFPRNP